MSFDPSILQVGDCLLYRPSSVFGWLIAVKTFTRISHVEVYVGGGKSFTSRDGKGVDIYPLRTDGLAAVRRPVSPLPNLDKALAWTQLVRGQAYDFKDLWTFLLMGKPSGDPLKMICSESVACWYKEVGYEAVNLDVNSEAIAPADFYKTGALRTIWKDGK